MNDLSSPRPGRTIANVPDGMQPMVLARLIQQRIEAAPDDAASIVFVARDGRRMQRIADILGAMLPGHTILTLPAWDCLPYDRVSPNNVTIAARMNTLAALTSGSMR
jgi:transcription-repair coupling factor (superfamily II helicase)